MRAIYMHLLPTKLKYSALRIVSEVVEDIPPVLLSYSSYSDEKDNLVRQLRGLDDPNYDIQKLLRPWPCKHKHSGH